MSMFWSKSGSKNKRLVECWSQRERNEKKERKTDEGKEDERISTPEVAFDAGKGMRVDRRGKSASDSRT